MNNCKPYKQIWKTQRLNYLWYFISILLILLPIAVTIFTKFLVWWMFFPYAVISIIGSLLHHLAINAIDECDNKLNALRDCYENAMLGGVKSEVFVAAINYMEDNQSKYSQGQYKVVFHDDDTYSIVQNETETVVYHGGANENE